MNGTDSVSTAIAGTAADDRRWVIAAAAATLYILAFTAIPASSVEIRTVLSAAGDLGGALMILAGVLRYQPRRPKAWLLLAGGLGAWAIADSIFGAYQSAGEDPEASLADLFYLFGYGLLVAGLLGAVRVRSPIFDLRALFDPAIITVGAGFLAWVYIASPVVRNQAAGTLETLVSVAYPLADVLLLSIAAYLTLGVRRSEPALLVLLAGLALVLAGDIWFALASGEPIVDTLLLAGALSIGLAGLHRSMPALTERRDVRLSSEEERLTFRLVALSAVFLLVPTVLIVEDSRDRPLPLVAALITTTLLSALVVGRYAFFFVVSRRAATRERELRQELDEQNEQLREMDRMKDRFVSSVSHELRTPLTSIVGYTELLLDEDEFDNLEDEQRQFLETIDRNCHRLTRLVDDILFIARVDAGRLSLELQPVDLVKLVAAAVESSRPFAARKNQTLTLDAEPELPALQADPTRISQLIDNLTSNAIKYTPEGGAVTVTLTRSGEHAHIRVIDTGVGIPADEMDKLFVRFFRASTAGAAQGTGLGLSIVKSIVEAHRGTVEVRSQPGEGTTFLIDLPLDVSEHAPASTTTEASTV